MNIKLLMELNKHNIYFVKSDMTSYYIGIPKNGISNTNISIDIKSKMGNFNLDLNDETWVLENVKNAYNYVDDYNITLVLPILNDDMLSVLEKMDNNRFNVIDRIISSVINSSFQLLQKSNIIVDPSIILINNERYKTFINWFLAKYNGRVICKNMLEVIHMFNVSATSYKTLKTPNMSFVVGSYTTEIDAPLKEEPPVEVIPQKQELQPAHSGGFASYYFLAILAIVIGIIVILIAF